MRAEHFLANAAHVAAVGHAIDERRQVTAFLVARIAQRAALKQHFAAFLLGQRVVAEHLFARRLVDDRPREECAIERVADLEPLRRGRIAFGEFVDDLLRDQDAPRRHATLAAGLESADDRRVDRQIEPGVFADDDRRFAAHLGGDDAIEKVGRDLLNSPADIVAAGEEDDVHVPIADQRLADRTVAVNEVDRPARESPLQRTSSTSRWPMPGVSSEGLKTAVLPSSSDGASIHSGTANGKFHGVITATTPYGLRRTKASFSAISEATMTPIGMRPVPKTYCTMCRPSTTSARHSPRILPHSRAINVARLSVSRSIDPGQSIEAFRPVNAAGSTPVRECRLGRRDGVVRYWRRAGGECADDFVAIGRIAARECVLAGRQPLAGDEMAARDW